MVEKVETGGMVSFDYSNFEKGKLSDERKRSIGEGYEKYNDRKRRERRNRWIVIIIIILIALVAGVFLF